MGQRVYGHRGDRDADDYTEAPQSGDAARRLLQHEDFQGVCIHSGNELYYRAD
jgi:hypothetical protein